MSDVTHDSTNNQGGKVYSMPSLILSRFMDSQHLAGQVVELQTPVLYILCLTFSPCIPQPHTIGSVFSSLRTLCNLCQSYGCAKRRSTTPPTTFAGMNTLPSKPHPFSRPSSTWLKVYCSRKVIHRRVTGPLLPKFNIIIQTKRNVTEAPGRNVIEQ